jgi:hypothetical protein
MEYTVLRLLIGYRKKISLTFSLLKEHSEVLKLLSWTVCLTLKKEATPCVETSWGALSIPFLYETA